MEKNTGAPCAKGAWAFKAARFWTVFHPANADSAPCSGSRRRERPRFLRNGPASCLRRERFSPGSRKGALTSSPDRELRNIVITFCGARPRPILKKTIPTGFTCTRARAFDLQTISALHERTVGEQDERTMSRPREQVELTLSKNTYTQ
ncbi:unnamed protein product, partial [Amoebophrya sp. A120]|eukprot:GSA120T00010988001.1